MKIITENQILVEGKDSRSGDDYSSFNWDGLKDKAKGLVGSGKVTGVLGALSGNTGNANVGGGSPLPPPPPAKKKMTTTVKVLIAVGGLALIGGIIYFIKKKK